MSSPALTIATLPRISPSTLRKFVTSSSVSESLAIVDVRDSDHIGGHIKSSTHAPSSTLDYKMPELVRTLQDKKIVVFHCMLSQQRGPSAALRYARERQRLLGKRGKIVQSMPSSDEEGRDVAQDGQTVVILQGGFDAWQQRSVASEAIHLGL